MHLRKFILVAGPSGVGKGTLIQRLMDAYPGRFGFSVSHTTRDPRPGEVNGQHYHFVAHTDFKALLEKGGFVETAEVHGNFYGTSKGAIADVESRGLSCILDVDVQGAVQVHAAGMGFYNIFVKPPSVDRLRKRLEGRGTESPEKVDRRMATAIRELEFAEANEGGVFDALIVNDDLELAVKEMKRLVQAPAAARL